MRYLIFGSSTLFLLLAPNLIWLGTSTVRIQNTSDLPIDSIAYIACETPHQVGTLDPGQSTFHFLQACGDDTLEILIDGSRFCQTYVEGELYHVDATISAVDIVSCSYDDLLSSLFVSKAF